MIIKIVMDSGFEDVHECDSYHIQREFDPEIRKEFSNPDKTIMITIKGGDRNIPHHLPVNLAKATVYIMNKHGQTIEKYHMHD